MRRRAYNELSEPPDRVDAGAVDAAALGLAPDAGGVGSVHAHRLQQRGEDRLLVRKVVVESNPGSSQSFQRARTQKMSLKGKQDVRPEANRHPFDCFRVLASDETRRDCCAFAERFRSSFPTTG